MSTKLTARGIPRAKQQAWPLFGAAAGAHAIKAALIRGRRGITPAEQEQPTRHSARRPGAKRHARLGGSALTIAGLGWRSTATVLGYVEEALAVTTSRPGRPCKGPS